MANYREIISEPLGKINKELLNMTQDNAGVLTSPVNKLWRAAILLHRATHYPHQDISKVDPADGNNVLVKQAKRGKSQTAKDSFESKYVSVDLVPHDDLLNQIPQNGIEANKIIIYNLTSKPYEFIVIQNRPNKLEFRGETTWATIKSMGRNTPMYHYTGSEDVIQFNISWYCDDPDHRDEVINKCRFLEAWSKSNGYEAAPPVLMIEWGNSGIFDGHFYILTSATYSLDNFNNYYQDGNRMAKDGRLLPSTATQELIFKRVSSTNLSWNDILPVSKMQYTRGLNKY